MTTTITIIVIIAMLWLAWPRTPNAPPLLLTRQQMIDRLAVSDIERITALPADDETYWCWLHPKDPPLKLKEEE